MSQMHCSILLLFLLKIGTLECLRCASFDQFKSKEEQECDPVSDINCTLPVIECHTRPACFVSWKNTSSNVHIDMKGCWGHGHLSLCRQDECVDDSYKSSLYPEKYHFCCCFGDLCNAQFSAVYIENDERLMITEKSKSSKQVESLLEGQVFFVVYWVIAGSVTLVTLIAIFLSAIPACRAKDSQAKVIQRREYLKTLKRERRIAKEKAKQNSKAKLIQNIPEMHGDV